MIDIEALKHEIVERLKPLNPDKIILFGSYAYGAPTEDSDIDLFLIKDDLSANETRQYELEAIKRLRDVRRNYKTNGIDILSASSHFINSRDDYFYKVDILQNGKVWYERTSG
ncbi:MAG TPA: nucleotidyltransferase domain-containing protein [Campylobacterales bacterium]|nr:nucleotidyltransferase domain-containing protein [Campylobacterales bacterium]